MRLVIDSKIPYLRGFAELLGEVTYLNGGDITAGDVRTADAIVIRTRTRCDRALLAGSRVRFIATATIGYDHLDRDYLAEAGIAWANAPGCNAASVGQYVRCAMLLLAAHGAWMPGRTLSPAESQEVTPLAPRPCAGLTLGIVGLGHVGTAVAAALTDLGFERILVSDPPRARREGAAAREQYVALEELVARCDVVTIHTPLTYAPDPDATYHLFDDNIFSHMRPGTILLNAGRGEVVDTTALLRAMKDGVVRAAVIDTWENEPHISLALLRQAWLATPHIAGYSADGKANGSRMALTAVAQHFGADTAPFAQIAPPALPPDFCYYPEGTGCRLHPALRRYDPTRDSVALKTAPERFEALRGAYPLRREGE